MTKATPTDERPPHSETVEESIRYDFSRDELLELGRNLARSSQAAATAEEHKKEVDSQLKADIDGHYAEAGKLSHKINCGYEMREILCERVFDFQAGTVTLVRLDTGETVRERAMRADERQMALPVGTGS